MIKATPIRVAKFLNGIWASGRISPGTAGVIQAFCGDSNDIYTVEYDGASFDFGSQMQGVFEFDLIESTPTMFAVCFADGTATIMMRVHQDAESSGQFQAEFENTRILPFGFGAPPLPPKPKLTVRRIEMMRDALLAIPGADPLEVEETVAKAMASLVAVPPTTRKKRGSSQEADSSED